MAATPKMTATELAKELDVDPRTVRRWLRTRGVGVGKGKGYEFTKAEAKRLAKAFEASRTPNDEASS